MANTLDQLTILSIIFLITVRISGFLAFLGIGFGFGVASWLISRVIVRSVAPPSDDTAPRAVPRDKYQSVEHGDKASSASSVRRRVGSIPYPDVQKYKIFL